MPLPLLAKTVCQFYKVPYLDGSGRHNFPRFTAGEVEYALLHLEEEASIAADEAPQAEDDDLFADL